MKKVVEFKQPVAGFTHIEFESPDKAEAAETKPPLAKARKRSNAGATVRSLRAQLLAAIASLEETCFVAKGHDPSTAFYADQILTACASYRKACPKMRVAAVFVETIETLQKKTRELQTLAGLRPVLRLVVNNA